MCWVSAEDRRGARSVSCETDAARTELLGVTPRFDRGALHGSPLDGDLVTARCGRGRSSSTTHQRAQHGGCQAEVGNGTARVCSIDPSSSALRRATAATWLQPRAAAACRCVHQPMVAG